MMDVSKTKWLIWSVEHGAWWKPNACGYCHYRQDAGRYTFEEACAIVRDANEGREGHPNEVMLLCLENEMQENPK